jgi:hypothetical protein
MAKDVPALPLYQQPLPAAFLTTTHLPDPTWATGDEPIGHGDEISE